MKRFVAALKRALRAKLATYTVLVSDDKTGRVIAKHHAWTLGGAFDWMRLYPADIDVTLFLWSQWEGWVLTRGTDEQIRALRDVAEKYDAA